MTEKIITLASTDNVKNYEKEIEKILKILGYPEALVTDESRISDFFNIFGNDTDDKKKIKKLEKNVNFCLRRNDLIITVAEYMRNFKKPSLYSRIKEEIRYMFPFKQIREFRYYLKNRFIRKPHLIDTKLKKGQWWDTDSRLLYGMMNLLIEFVEKERPFEVVIWDSDDVSIHVKKEILTIKAWWENYNNRKNEISEALSTWHDMKFGKDSDDWIDKINEDDTPEIDKAFKYLHELENKLHEEEEEMLIRLVKIRDYLWT